MAPTQPPKIVTQGSTNADDSSDDHFSSASEGGPHAPKSPIPITRVERVDDKPAFGEVPGTPSYAKRVWDAVPDEIEVVPEGQRSRSGTRSRAVSNLNLSETPQSRSSGSPVPKTVVERVDHQPAHGEVEGTAAHDKRLADAEPDEVRQADDTKGSIDLTMSSEPQETESATRAFFHKMWESSTAQERLEDDIDEEQEGVEENEETEAADDRFDEYAIGDDEEFGDFDEIDETPLPEAEPDAKLEHPPPVLPDLPKIDFSTKESTQNTIDIYLDDIFEDDTSTKIAQPTETDLQPPTAFLSERSLSLWRQLVSPPPMQPPNWTRSRIRRLFLVSLGVPVDLDEILPPSKQKRLVLPNINIATSPRASTVMDRLKETSNNDSTTSLDSRTGAPKPPKPKRTPRGPPPPPDFDLNAAAILSTTTDEALAGYDDAEIVDHVETLETLNHKASSVLEYWLVRRDESTREKEALEGVIENLVGFVKGMRKK